MNNILSQSFSFEKFVEANLGGLKIGSAVLQDGKIAMVDSQSFTVPLEKFQELMKFLKNIGRDICGLEVFPATALQLPHVKLAYQKKTITFQSQSIPSVDGNLHTGEIVFRGSRVGAGDESHGLLFSELRISFSHYFKASIL